MIQTKPKLAIFLYSLASGGAERVASILCHSLADQLDITLVLMNDTITYSLPSNQKIVFLEKSNANESGIKKLIKLPFLAFRYAKIVRGFDVSFSMMNRPNIINTMSRFFGNSAKIIISERAMPSYEYGYKNLQSFVMKTLIRLFYNRADLVTTNSYGNRADLINNFGISKQIKVLYNPLDLELISTKKDETIDEEDKFIISIGRLDQGKNHQLLIRAYKKLNIVNKKLLIFGDGVLKTELQNLIDELKLTDQILLKGYEPNPYKYLSKAHSFWFASNHEGFANVLLEAIACELPIITTDHPSGAREIVAPTTNPTDHLSSGYEIAQFGTLVATDDLDAFVSAVQNTPYEEHRKNAKSRAVEFDKEKLLERFVKLLTE